MGPSSDRVFQISISKLLRLSQQSHYTSLFININPSATKRGVTAMPAVD